MEILKKIFKKKEKPRNLWKEDVDYEKYQWHVTIPSIDSTNESVETDEEVVYIGDLEKRKEAYGICGECNEPGTGGRWCQPCNAKRLKENFKNWTSGNKEINEFIQQSQLNAVCFTKCLEWIPFENFQNVTYITRGGFGKVYYADWPEGVIFYWDIENQKWNRISNIEVALKSLDGSSNISTDFLNEIKSHLQIYLFNKIIRCYGVTQDPNTKDYMMVLEYCEDGNLRDNLNKSKNYDDKIWHLKLIANGLLNIHNAGKIHKDFHSGNILFDSKPKNLIANGLLNIHNAGLIHRDFHSGNILFGAWPSAWPRISDLGMCQPANNVEQSIKKEGRYGVLPYMAPEVLRGYEYTMAADIYSFGIIMNEYMSEETPYNDISHDHILAIKICKGLRPKISEDTPKLLADLIMKCWDAKAENRPTAKELFQILNEWYDDAYYNKKGEIYSQIKECEKIRENKLKNSSSKNKPNNIQTHPQAIYTSRLLNFKNLPVPINSSDLSSFQVNSDTIPILPLTSANIISECLDVQLSELDLNEINQDGENNTG